MNLGDLIAIVESSNKGAINIYANATGTVTRLSAEGEVIYDSENSKHVIEVGAHNLTEIKYVNLILVTHPNGDPLTHNIPLIVIWLIFGAAYFTVKMGFINFKGIRHSIDLARGKYDDPEAPGKITHFQTMTTAFSTMISWSYYGMGAWTYIFGKTNRSELIYKAMFLIFVVIGASVGLGAVLDFSDMIILTMAFPNIIGLYIMSGEVRKDLREYIRKLKAGELFKKPSA